MIKSQYYQLSTYLAAPIRLHASESGPIMSFYYRHSDLIDSYGTFIFLFVVITFMLLLRNTYLRNTLKSA